MVDIEVERSGELAFMFRRYSAQQAYETGLINAVVAGDELE